jgi:hypothetical protein
VEDAPVTLLNPSQPLLQHAQPHRPFKGWTGTGTCTTTQMGPYQTVLAARPGETARKDAILVTGAATYIYAGLSFFRSGCLPGAWRLPAAHQHGVVGSSFVLLGHLTPASSPRGWRPERARVFLVFLVRYELPFLSAPAAGLALLSVPGILLLIRWMCRWLSCYEYGAPLRPFFLRF